VTSTKVLVLAIDAASPDLLERWAEDGTLPNLRALMTRGLIGRTRNVDGFHIGSTWPSWSTGVTPARHGLHYLVQLKPGTYETYRPAEHGLIQREPFWTHLSRAGRRVAVLDVPLSTIDRGLNGVQTVEWGGHDVVFGLQSHPTDLAGKILSTAGAYPLATPCDQIGRTLEGYTSFVDRLVAGVRSKTKWTLDLLGRDDWDFFVQVFTEAHCAGHQCWHLHDPSHPAHDSSVAARLGDPLRSVYQAIDTGIGQLLNQAGDTRVVVLSLHGMSHAFGAQFLLRDLLIQLGVTQPLPTTPPPTGVAARATDGLRAIWRRLPRSMRNRIAPFKDRLVQRHTVSTPPPLGVDTSRSRCFPHNNGLAVGGIRLNLGGREPNGLVESGAVARAFEDELIRDLLDVVDERTRRPLIRRVLRTRDHYDGEHLKLLPDLLVEWDDVTPVGSSVVGRGVDATVRGVSPKTGTVIGTNHFGRTGEHRPEGLFIAAGPGIRPGRLERSVSILDFAPTFATIFDVSLPESDGAAIPELLDGWRARLSPH
jgi:predicted AlkP superfamily phosphohydrolase/phosphomutase